MRSDARWETRQFSSWVLVSLLALAGCLLGPGEVTAQGGHAATSIHRLTCQEAAQVLHKLADLGGPDKLAAAGFTLPRGGSLRDWSSVLAALTAIRGERGICAAAIALRGAAKWQLRQSGLTPRDGPGQRAGASWAEDAIRDLTRASRSAKPVAVDAAALAATAILESGPNGAELLDELGPSLVTTLAEAGDDASRQWLRARIASRLSLLMTADTAIHLYRALHGPDELAELELARIELALGATSAESLYYHIAETGNAAVASEIILDIESIADSAESSEVQRVTRKERPAWLRRFWEERDLASLRPRGSRLYEHYRRLAYARAHYRLRRYPRRYETYELWRNPTSEFDDRGLIYLRHGAPDDSASAVRFAACPNVSWLYRRPESNLVFHFVARDDPDDWRLVETLDNVGGGNGATNRLRRQDSLQQCQPVDGLFTSRMNIDPIYGRLAVTGSRRNFEDELALVTRSRLVGTRSDSYELRFAKTIRSALQAYGLFGQTSRARVLLVLSAQVGDLDLPSDSIAALRLHVVATRDTSSVERDTTRRFRAHGGATAWLTILDELNVVPGDWNVGLVVRAGPAGQFFRINHVHVPRSDELDLSDIVAAQEEDGRPWTARDGVLQLNPTGTYRIGQPILLYYEIAGGSESPLITEVTGSDGHRIMRLSFGEPVHEGVRAVRRTLSTQGLQAGRFTITVTVRAPDGKVARQSLAVTLVKP